MKNKSNLEKWVEENLLMIAPDRDGADLLAKMLYAYAQHYGDYDYINQLTEPTSNDIAPEDDIAVWLRADVPDFTSGLMQLLEKHGFVASANNPNNSLIKSDTLLHWLGIIYNKQGGITL